MLDRQTQQGAHPGRSIPQPQPPDEPRPPDLAGRDGGSRLCPCHGSTFDGAGRVFKNKPAPTNLEVPPYRFESEARILIGQDTAA
jgi:ubiquinol-cytochrome c reductase iron-sulfur subunit